MATEATIVPVPEVSPAPAPAASPEVTAVGEDQLLSPQQNQAQPVPPAEQPAQPETGEIIPKRKQGRPRGSRNRIDDFDGSPSRVPNIGDIQVAAEAVAVDYKLMAETTFDISISVAASALGPEWSPKDEQERQMVCVPMAAYFKSKQMKDLPPNLALALVVTAYAAPRFREPSTAGKMRLFWAWCKEQVNRFRSK